MMGAHEARRPDSSTGTDLEEQGTGFAFSIGELSRLFNPNSLAALEAFGGLRGIEKGLRTDVNRGIGNPHKTLLANSTSSAQSNKSINGTETIDRRVCAYGKNVLPLPKTKSFGLLMRTFCPVKVLFIISLILAISVTFCHFEFIVLCTIIDITVIAVALHSWQREYVSIKAKAERHKWRETKVIRSGKTYLIKLRDVVVGDVLCLDPGDFVPVDGVLISGFGIKMDESRVTRRTGAVEKIPGDDAMRLIHASPKLNDLDPFIFSGSQVLEGVGTFVCTSVGVYSVLGRKTMLSFEEPVPRTPVQKMLDDMERSVFPLISSITSWILGIVIITGTIVIAIPRTICRALRFKICSLPTEEVSSSGLFQTRGKTDSITKTWRARVLAGTISTTSFGQPCWSNMMNEARPVKTIPEWASDLSLVAKDTIIQSIATNSTAFEERTDNTSKFIGSGTEVALLGFAREHLGMQCLAKIRNSEQIVWSIPFDSKLMCMAVVIRLRTGGYRLLVRGAAEMILAHCVARVEVENGNETQLTMADQRTLQSTAEILDGPWRQSICLAYRDYQQWPPTDIRAESGDVDLGILVKDLTFLGIFSIAFPICASYEPSALQSPNLIVRCGRAAVNTVREISWAYGITTGRHQIDCFLGLSPRVGMVMYALITLLLDTNIRGCIELAPSDVNPRTFVVRAHWPAHLDVVALGRTYFFCSILVGIITILLRNIYMPVCRSITYLMERRRSSLYSRMRFQAQARMFEIRGKINGRSIIANADTGASYNIISESLARSMNLNIRPQTAGEILLPSGRRLFSRGQVSVRYQFAGEKTIHHLPCVVLPLPAASYDLILGGSFLKMTRTCTSHIHRMKRVFSSLGRISLNLIGGQQEFVAGYLNGRECLAVPDTGSDIMVMSRGYAKKLGLKIYKKSHYRSKVQFIDGSKVMTDGIARDVRWQFRPGEAPIRCDFHVIRRLPVRAILSNALIDEFNVFSKYHDRIGQPKSTYDEHCGIFGIALIERCREEIRSLSESFTEDITSDAPFTPEKVERERARRDEIRDRIAKVPEPLRAEEQAREDQRQSQWNDLWRRHREGNTPPPNILPPRQVVNPTPPDRRRAQYTTPLVGVVVDNGNNRRFGHSPHRVVNKVPFWVKWWHNRRRL